MKISTRMKNKAVGYDFHDCFNCEDNEENILNMFLSTERNTNIFRETFRERHSEKHTERHIEIRETFREAVRRHVQFCAVSSFIHSFIHSGHFYGAPSSTLLLRGAPDYSTDTVSSTISLLLLLTHFVHLTH